MTTKVVRTGDATRLMDLPPVVIEAICVYEGLMILGFAADDIWCMIQCSALTGQKSIFIELTGKPGEFSILVGACDLPDEEIQKHWMAGTEAWNASAPSEVQPIWDRSTVVKELPFIAAAIRQKGIIVPVFAN